MADPAVETIILRFRDLPPEEVGTIAAHAAKIRERGFTWWGWWNKPGEKIPTEVFSHLAKSIAEKGALEVLLFDAGKKQVFEAACLEIKWDPACTKIRSPDETATPAYYAGAPCLAWFKLTRVSENDGSVLPSWSYVDVDNFFEGGQSRYRPFHEKQVHSADELVQQQRTIWFVRRYRKGDTTHEIRLLDSVQSVPADFPEEYRVSSYQRLLWVSDLHFSLEDHHGFPREKRAAEKVLAARIVEALRVNSQEGCAGILVSGDLTWRADPGEFREAVFFIKDLSRRLGLDDSYCLTSPGNHDIPFSLEPWINGQWVDEVARTSSDAYASFYQSLFHRQPNEFLAAGRRLIVRRSIPVEIAALNSQRLKQKEGLFQGHGLVGDDQLEYAATRMGWGRREADELPLRMVMLHHHLLPVSFREIPKAGANYSVALDAEAVVRWVVERRVKIVLHGHQHQPFYSKVTRESTPGKKDEHEFCVLGLGSTGVEKSHLGEIAKNTFGVLDFSRSSVTFRVFTVDPVYPSEKAWEVTIPI